MGFPVMNPPKKDVKKMFVRHPWSPTWTEFLFTMGCGLVSQGNRLSKNTLYPSAMMPSNRKLPPWLG